MPEEQTRVELQALLFCQWINVTTDQTRNLIGVFDNLHAAAFPINIPFFVHLKFFNAYPNVVMLRFFDPDRVQLWEAEFTGFVQSSPGHVDLHVQAGVIANKPGLYWCEAFSDGQPIGRAPLRIDSATSGV